jgi:hypothetical protein
MQLSIRVQWEHTILRVKDVDLTATKEAEGKPYALVTLLDDKHAKCVHRENNTGKRETFFTNNVAFLTEPGSFAYDWYTGTLYVYPPAESLVNNSFIYPTLENLITFKGMKGVTVEGLTFTGTTSTYVCRDSYHSQLTNVEVKGRRLPHAAIMGYDLEDVTVRDCTFAGLGGSGMLLWGKTMEARVYDNRFVDVAMVSVGVGDYIGRWSVPNGRTESPEVMEKYFSTVAYDLSIVNNYFEHIAYDYPNCAAIYVCFADCLKITHNTINGCAYSGANFVLGERVNLRDVEISYNRVHNFMMTCRDGAAIYVTGGNSALGYTVRFNKMHHNYAFLDVLGNGDTIGCYFDGAASHWKITDNVVDNLRLPLYTRYNIPCQYTHHCTINGFYSTTNVDGKNHRPYHDVLMENCVVVPDMNELLARHPIAKEIVENAGYRKHV